MRASSQAYLLNELSDVRMLRAGISVDQAGALAELLGGQRSLLPVRRRPTICDLIKLLKRYSADPVLWDELCPV